MAKEIEKYNKESLLEAITSIKQIIAENKMALLQSANAIIIKTYWEIGKRIVEIEQDGKVRAAYGSNLLKNIAIELTEEYGSGYSERNLAYARKAYVLYPDYNILQTRLQNLSWSHLCLLTGVEEDAAREWYFQAASVFEQYAINHPVAIDQITNYSSSQTKLKQAASVFPTLFAFIGWTHHTTIIQKMTELYQKTEK